MADDVLKTLIAEAYGEGPEGMRRVAEVILNRAAIEGKTPEQIVNERAQFTGLTSPGSAAKRAWSDPKAVAAAQAALDLAMQPGDPTGGADHYHADSVSPWWADKMPSTGSYGGHTFYASRPVPPGEIPNVVASLTDTVPGRPVPVTPSPNIATLRNPPPLPRSRPDASTVAEQSFARLQPRPSTANLGDNIAMSPIQGGRQQAPLFDAAFDERSQAMRLLSEPIDSQGIAVGRSRPPAPVPAQQSPHLASRRATDRDLQTALNARYPTLLPPIAPLSPERATTIATIPTTGGQTEMQRLAALYAGGGPTRPMPTVPDRLMPGPAGPPALYGGMSPLQVAQIGTGVDEFDPLTGRPLQPRTRVAQAGNVAPIPFPPYRAVATALSVPPPMPRPRPAMPAPRRTAPVPMPLAMRPTAPARAPLQIVVNGANSYGSGSPSSPSVVKGHTSSGGRRYDPDTAQWT